MTTVSRFSRQNDGDLRALNVFLWENLVLVVVLVLESKGLNCLLCLLKTSYKMFYAYQSFQGN